ncbi:glycosyltransferase [Corynebacterium liangguodongii]|uniref:Glycosyl transferase family 2 n=1 Tax=Corynebacterium liangguodongii TaxID=2079535 RepID=A0A2S0WFJ1_9CORY|nr:glycosyltransferase family 4 protein [Corynebacterium liangguodongii]AWB84538.1 glycosyl transferase family 2 [Corynebacterium liangguodongii]PWB98878.1 glycosyl transferase family 2 [Corynebacterium liangguodongii]
MTEHVRDVRVLSIPAEHPYTQAIRPPGVSYLPDPDIGGHWWPHPAFEASFWEARPRAWEADLVHIHFGFEHRSPTQIAELADAIDLPMVLTVHDIDNPHLSTAPEQAAHHERLRTLIGAADEVLTLTECAAERLRSDFGAADITVVPHPAITLNPAAARREPVAGVFLKSLRSNVVNEPAFYRAIAEAVALRVFIHRDADPRVVRSLAGELAGKAELIVHDPFDDAALHREVARLTACVLPYTRGTHSGWLEMCRDHGTTVAVPAIGCYAGQADAPGAVEAYAPGDGASAARAVRLLLERGPVAYAGSRAAQFEQVRDAHAQAYARACTKSRGGVRGR